MSKLNVEKKIDNIREHLELMTRAVEECRLMCDEADALLRELRIDTKKHRAA